jgi:acetoacetate decarboxylase
MSGKYARQSISHIRAAVAEVPVFTLLSAQHFIGMKTLDANLQGAR